MKSWIKEKVESRKPGRKNLPMAGGLGDRLLLLLVGETVPGREVENLG